MDNFVLLSFIEKRRKEQERCINASEYIDHLKHEFYFSNEEDYLNIKRILNNRFLFFRKIYS